MTALLREGFQELAEPLHVNPIGGAVSADLERVASSMSNDDNQAFVVAVLHDGETTEVAVRDPTQEIYAAILLAFGLGYCGFPLDLMKYMADAPFEPNNDAAAAQQHILNMHSLASHNRYCRYRIINRKS